MNGKEYKDYTHELANLIKKGQVLFFVGSGISTEKPTFLPTGISLRNEIVKSFCFDKTNEIELRFLKAIEKITLEEVSQVIHEHRGNQLLTILSNIFDNPRIKPNVIHRFLAKAITFGNIIVTTNYDSLIEKAYIENNEKRNLRIFYNDTHFDEINDYLVNIFSAKEDLRLKSNIFKLHGTLQDITKNNRNTKNSVITILSRVESLSVPKTKVLRKLFGVYHAVFMGYSARDLDVFYALLEILQDKAILDEGFGSIIRAYEGKKYIFDEINDYRKEIRKEYKKSIPEFALEATILETTVMKKIFWIKYTPSKKTLKIQKCSDIKQKSIPGNDFSTMNINELLLTKCEYGPDLGIKIEQAPVNFIGELIKSLNWNLRELDVSYDQQSKIKSQIKNILKNWARKLPTYTRTLILADIAEKARDWDLALNFCNDAKLTTKNLEFIAEIERRFGWYFYQRNHIGDAIKALHHYKISSSSYQYLEDKFEEARIQSSIGLLYNRRQRELKEKGLDAAKTYVEDAWKILRPILDPTNMTNIRIIKEEKIDEVADKLIEMSGNLSPAQKRILAKVWGGIAHVYLRLSGEPGEIIVSKGKPVIEEEDRQLLYNAITLLKATRQLEKDEGAIRDLIQTDHLIGLLLTRLGKYEEAIKIHELWIRKTRLLGWEHEYSQACRNLGVAYVYEGNFSKGQKQVEKSIKYWQTLQALTGEDRTEDIEGAKKLKGKISNLKH